MQAGVWGCLDMCVCTSAERTRQPMMLHTMPPWAIACGDACVHVAPCMMMHVLPLPLPAAVRAGHPPHPCGVHDCGVTTTAKLQVPPPIRPLPSPPLPAMPLPAACSRPPQAAAGAIHRSSRSTSRSSAGAAVAQMDVVVTHMARIPQPVLTTHTMMLTHMGQALCPQPT